MIARPCPNDVSPWGRNRRNAVKTIVKVLGLATLVALAACDSKEENKVENVYENQADALDNQAANMESMADNLSGSAENAAENAADKIENKADATREAGEKAGDAVENKM
jgi:methyl-accepting chemotaxis protein